MEQYLYFLPFDASMKYSAIVIIVFCMCFMETFSQQFLTPHTMGADSSLNNAATLHDTEFLAGYWKGTGFGGIVEEQWSLPLAGSMVGTFRLVKDGKNIFYEIMELTETNGSLILRVKHFSPEFVAWEEKDKYVTFHLVTIRNSNLYFNGLTIEKTEKGIRLYIRMKKKDGSVSEEVLDYTKIM